MSAKKQINAFQWISIWLFPFCQILSFVVFAMGISHHWAFVILIPVAAFFLNFSLHITYHYTVHFPVRNVLWQTLLGMLKSAFMGLPFHYYAMSHWNHHKHNNDLDDFTSTWQRKREEIVPKNVILYTLFWPFASTISLKDQLKIGIKEGYCTPRFLSRMALELVSNSLFFIALGWLNWQWLIGYFVMVYLGWLLISLHNYGQHLPQTYASPKANSYFAGWYNAIFINNGLHEEHHEAPAKTYWELSASPQTDLSEIKKPHLIEALFPTQRSN